MSDEWDEREALGVDEIVRRLPPYFTICCMSCRNSGKSVLISQLVRELIKLKKVDVVIVMSGTAGLTTDWDFLPGRMVMSFSEEMLGRIARKQESDVEAWKHPVEGREKPKKPKHVLLVLDDCLSTPDALNSPVISQTFSFRPSQNDVLYCDFPIDHEVPESDPETEHGYDFVESPELTIA